MDDGRLVNCRNCGSHDLWEMVGTDLFHRGNEYFVMCSDCGAAGDSIYDFGVAEDAGTCAATARESWNTRGWVGKRPSLIELFRGRGEGE